MAANRLPQPATGGWLVLLLRLLECGRRLHGSSDHWAGIMA